MRDVEGTQKCGILACIVRWMHISCARFSAAACNSKQVQVLEPSPLFKFEHPSPHLQQQLHGLQIVLLKGHEHGGPARHVDRRVGNRVGGALSSDVRRNM